MKNVRLRWIGLVGLGLVCVLFPISQAQGGACCMSSTVAGVGRLRQWEKFALGLQTSFAANLGLWDTRSQWQSNGPGDLDYEWRSEIWTLVGLSKKLSVFGRLPWVMNYRQTGQLADVGGFVSDIQLGGRYDLLSFGEVANAPIIAVLLSVTMPTGRDTWHTSHPLASDVTGRGAWVVGAALSVEKTFYPIFVRLDLGVQVPMPMYRDDLKTFQRYGVGVQGLLFAGIEVHPKLILSLSLRIFWEDHIRQDEQTLANSFRIDTGAGFQISWMLHEHWTLVGSLDTGIFASFLGHNQPGRFSGSLGVRYGHF